MYERTCKGCGNEFSTGNFNQRRCHVSCGRAPRKKPLRSQRTLEFVGVDGEGVDRPDGTHEYVMLSVGNETLFRNGDMLETSDIFAFLYDCFRANPDAAYVGFFLGYDFIQWEKGLPQKIAYSLLTTEGILARKRKGAVYPDPVVWRSWEFDILAGRRWKLRPHVHVKHPNSYFCKLRTCDYVFAEEIARNSGEPIRVRAGENLFTPSDGAECGPLELEWDDTYFELQTVPTLAPVASAGWMYICDTGPFWQQSFLKVINPGAWDGHPVCSDSEYKTIVDGKAERGLIAERGETGYYHDMVKYNILENDILARVTARLDSGFRNEHIPIYIPGKEWYGPGRAAQLWMDSLSERLSDPIAREHNATARRNPHLNLERKNEGTLKNIDVYSEMPEWAQHAAQATYYGGWFEQMVHGHVGRAYEYDINSAYPYIIASLPCLHTHGHHNGRFTRGTGDAPGHGYVAVHADIRGSNPYIGAMPFRDSKGLICRPNNVKGWYWLHEVLAAQRAGLVDNYTVKEWVAYEPCECPPPFNPPDIGIERMYNLRLEVGKNTPQGKGFKLVYNSAYGKTAQSIGSPKYSNPFYASLITAGCRTQILNAISTHPRGAESVTMVATDGVYFTSPHPSLKLSETELGAWDVKVKENLTQLMPGVYWDDATRDRIQRGGTPQLKSRGVNAKDLASQIEELDSLFDDLHTSAFFRNNVEWPELTFTVGFLLDSAKSALHRGKWEQAGRVQHSTTRKISSNPATKRDITTVYADSNMVRTRPYVDRGESIGYEKTFGYAEYLISQQTAEYVSIDGRDDMAWFRDLLADD